MSTLPKLLKSQATIRFQDCDPYNHLNNAAYLNYFMNAREDQVLDAYGLNIYSLGMQRGVGWVVSKSQIAYLKPAFLMERVTITTQIVQYGPRSMVVEFAMYSEDEAHLKALMWCTLVHVSLKTAKSIEHDEEMMDMFELVLVQQPAATFDERLEVVKSARVQN